MAGISPCPIIWRATLLAAALLAACGPEAKPADDAAQPTDSADGATSQDTAAWQPSCPGGIGCPCSNPADCDAKLCLETPAGMRCSAWCDDSACPPAWACKGFKSGGDATAFCIPEGGLLCRPCDQDLECQAAGHSGALCAAYGDEGGFCGLPCVEDPDCPQGYGCRQVSSQGGGAPKGQCVRTPAAGASGFGACGCSPHAASLELSTSCGVSTGEGLSARHCAGSRVCGKAGLGPCVAFQGAQAQCIDEQCRDPKSGLTRPDGTPCDDGRGCTKHEVCKLGTCQGGVQQCPCEPGFQECGTLGATNLCKGPQACTASPVGAALPFVCTSNSALAVDCDDSLDEPCQKNACAPLKGVCSLTPVELTQEICDLAPGADGKPGCRRETLTSADPQKVGLPCDDGLACSLGDSCGGGVCTAKDAAGCGCKTNADCPDNKDLCDGTPYCDSSGATWSCKVNPSTVVLCDTSGDSGCQVTACDISSGACKKGPAPQGKACDDGAPCTTGDACGADGACVPGTWTCCKADTDCAKQEDGDACNGTLYCNKALGKCELNPATVVTCVSVDDTPCRANLCDPPTGACAMTDLGNGKLCNDGDDCTDGDVCAAGTCKGGKDICDCGKDADCKAKDDGNFCNGDYYCNLAVGKCKPNPATVVACPSVDDSDCRKNTCQPKTGTCKPVDLPAEVTCDADGTGCTHHDVCDGKGNCLPGTPVCQCQSDAECGPFEDSNLCNGTLYCDKSGPSPMCRANPKTKVQCPTGDNTVCVKSLCQAASGKCSLQSLAAGSFCDDGDVCTLNTTCNGKGTCQGGIGVCVCSKDTDCGADDGDPCNGKTVCEKGLCVAQGPPVCDDGNACTDDLCVPNKGCVGLPTEASCTLGDFCSVGDACNSGACSAGKAVVCDDIASCTLDSCKPGNGCIYAPTAPCGDGQCGCGEHSGNCAKDCPPTCPAGAPLALVFTLGPSDGIAGLPLPKVEVAVRDAKGTTCAGALGTISLGLEPVGAGGALAGTTTAAPVAGVATFTALELAKAGTAWRLRASSAGVAPTLSAPFAVAPGAAAKLVFVQQPVSAVVGVALAPPPQVAVHDAGGNQVIVASGTLTLAVATGPAGATVQGGSAKIVQGIATFDALSFKPSGTYTLTAQAGGLTSTSASFAVVASAPAAKYSTVSADPAPGVADGGAGVALKAMVRDADGNPVPGRVAVFQAPAAGTKAKLTQPAQPTDLKGEALGALATTEAGSIEVKLLVDGVELASTSVAFVAGPPFAGKSSLTASGPSVADGKTPLDLALTLADANGNPVVGAKATLTANPVQGITFEPAAIVTNAAGKANAQVRSSAPGKFAIQATVNAQVVGSTEAVFTAGAPVKLVFTSQPPTAVAADGAGFGAKVQVLDGAGNPVAAEGIEVELTLKGSPADAQLEGKTKVGSVAGSATFAGVQLRKAGSYTLVASAPGLTPATSDFMNITPGKATGLAFVQGPTDTVVGALISPTVAVGLIDAYGNPDAQGTASLTLSIEGKPAIWPTGTEYSVTAKPSVPALFPNLRWPAPGTFQLRATTAGLDPALSGNFTIVDQTFLEVCNGKDDDANGKTDEGCDVDKDGVCNAYQTIAAGAVCAKAGGDCNDADTAIGPGVAEVCDGMDNGCTLQSARPDSKSKVAQTLS